MLRVRERQQEIANERAKQAAIERKQKEEEERKKRKDDAARLKAKNAKQRLGDATSGMNSDTTTSRPRSSSRNPLQPFASNTSSYRYVILSTRINKIEETSIVSIVLTSALDVPCLHSMVCV